MREIIFDTETTGLDHASGDRMVEIGCIEMVDRIVTGRTFQCYFNPDRIIPPGAEAVHGLSDIFLSDKPRFAERVAELLEFLEDSNLVAHNAAFDFGFLNNELAFCDKPPVGLDRMIDTIAIARVRHPGSKLSLDALCTKYGIDRSHRVKHGALLDAELLAQLYIELTGGRQIGLCLADSAAAVLPNAPTAIDGQSAVHAARAHSASAQEHALHAEFIAAIDGALWNQGAARA